MGCLCLYVLIEVCCNYEPHLRGNVYVQYTSEEDCQKAFADFNGRWYAGRQLSCEFSPVTNWKSAICGLFAQNRCPRGKNCNFLHVYRNPDDWSEQRSENLRYDRHSRRNDERDRRYSSDRSRQSSDRNRNRNDDYRAIDRDSYHYGKDYKDKRRKHRSRSRSHSDEDDSRKRKRRQRSRSRSYEKRDRKQLYVRSSVANGESLNEDSSKGVSSSKHDNHFSSKRSRARSQSPVSGNSVSSDSDRPHYRRKSKKKHKKRRRRSKVHENNVDISSEDST